MIRTSLVVGVLLLLASCTPHRVQYYQLSVTAKQFAPAETGPVLLVGRIATPQALQDGRIHYRQGLNEVGGYEYHRWTDPPGIIVKDALIHVLRASGQYKSVQDATSSPPATMPFAGNCRSFPNWTATASPRVFPSISSCMRSGAAAWSGTSCSRTTIPCRRRRSPMWSSRWIETSRGYSETPLPPSAHTLRRTR